MREAHTSARKRSTHQALMRTNKTWEDVRSYVTRELEANPLRTALLAVGAGYVLGGGLFSALTGRVVGTSARLALRAVSVPVILRGGMELGSQLFSADRDPSPAE